ncbi:MAG: acyltransferase [Acidobacteriaceae bacterium]|nr:acyltransferase [Acidobacteriaceae bacterium]
MTSFASSAGYVQPSAQVNAAKAGYNLPLGYLRAFVVVLVLAHHAVLAYHPYAPPPSAPLAAQPRWWEAFPVVDAQRSTGFAIFVGFNDIFFMSLMFFLSGLFVWNSLKRKGPGTFLRDRLLRLGLPFVVAAGVVAPIAYYPAYLQRNVHGSVAGFWQQWLSLGQWPAGPAWFIWVLLVFDCVATALFVLAPQFRFASFRRPAALFATLVAASAAVYIPMALAFSPMQWTAFGPFTFQTSRILHYLIYFLIAVGLGAAGLERGILAPDGKLARRWPLWALRALLAFGLAGMLTIAAATARAASQLWGAMADFAFVLSCAASGFAFLAVFIRFARSRVPLFDSLRDNCYGMYLIHYMFVSWLQYALLAAPLSALSKGVIVFVGTLALSWITVAAMRRIPMVARII